MYGVTGGIRTHGFRDLQSLAMDHSATVTLELVHREGNDPSTFRLSGECSPSELTVRGVEDGVRTRDMRYHKPPLYL